MYPDLKSLSKDMTNTNNNSLFYFFKANTTMQVKAN